MPAPQIPLVPLERIRSRLANRERLQLCLALFQIPSGLALCLVGPVFMTGIVWITLLLWGRWFSLWTVFEIAVAVMVPLQFWTEFRSRGEFLSGAAERRAAGKEARWLSGMLMVEFGLSNSMTMRAIAGGASPAGIVELMLWGPRQFISGAVKLRIAVKFARIDRPRAAQLLQTLLTKPRGEPVKNFLQQGEDRNDVLLALAYLAYFDWAGVAESGDRAWALTETRRDFGLSSP